MPSTTVHIINHTHWDREWFLTSVYTSRWIPGLIARLDQLVASNPDYRFLFDGQTLVIEDLLVVAPHEAERARNLIRAGHLIIGPYYCQPDWQLTSGELLIRNLLYGRQDMARHGASTDTGWLVDTFGHISQSPQIHQLFGIDAVYVWRGVPQLVPYFSWQGADGSRLLTIDLFGGYRNLYGVTHAPEVAVTRLRAEVDKLRPYYPTPDIPLFDGYDLEDNPEDPLRFYERQEIGADLLLRETTPAGFAREIGRKNLPLPVIQGELNSGKYGATFPGVFSARAYLKIMAHDCEQMLFRLCEPLAALAWRKGRAYDAAQYERWGRLLLQNAVHDCICGVSIDQVHEKMEYSYRRVFDEMLADVQTSLVAILRYFAPGDYAVSTNPFVFDGWQVVGQELAHIQTGGIGVWPVRERVPVQTADEPVETFTWRNDHYEAVVGADGIVHIDQRCLGALMVSAERGDTYSDEVGERLGEIRPVSPLTIAQRSAHHAVVTFRGAWQGAGAQVTATVRLYFDQSPLLRWHIDLDSRGKELRVEMLFDTAQSGEIFAAMPFDVVRRPVADSDLLPRVLPPTLTNLLLGQRELNAVTTFPCHDFVAIADGQTTAAVLTRGLRSYSAAHGAITLQLLRAVEWLTRSDLNNRIGDAGPLFYVPDARCERVVQHEVAVAIGTFAPDSIELQRLNAAFQNPPLIVRGQGHGAATSWPLLQEDVPLSSLYVRDEQLLARFYNPTSRPQPLTHAYQATDVPGTPTGEIEAIAARKIVTVRLPQALPGVTGDALDSAVGALREAPLLTPPAWRVGRNAGRPDTAIITQLEEKMAQLETRLAETAAQMDDAQDEALLRLQHQYYVIKRELLEFRLSALLNRRKMAQQGALSYDYLYTPDAEIAAVGQELNRLRIKRRIFDYVIAALTPETHK